MMITGCVVFSQIQLAFLEPGGARTDLAQEQGREEKKDAENSRDLGRQGRGFPADHRFLGFHGLALYRIGCYLKPWNMGRMNEY